MRLIRVSSVAATAIVAALGVTTSAHSVNRDAAAQAAVSSSKAPTTNTTPVAPTPPVGGGLPLFEFTRTGPPNLPWVATSLTGLLNGAGISAGPRSVETAQGIYVVAFATGAHDVGFVTIGDGPSYYTNLGTLLGLTSAADAPVPFFDSIGRLNLAYVTSAGHVMLATRLAPVATGNFGRGTQFLHRDWIVHDLSNATVTTPRPNGVLAAGQLDEMSLPGADQLVLRSTANELITLAVAAQRPFSVTTVTVVAPAVRGNPTFVGALGDGVVTIAATTVAGHLIIYRHGSLSWNATDLTSSLRSPPTTSAVAARASGATFYVATLAQSNGNLLLDRGTLSGTTVTWSYQNLTNLTASSASPGPPLAGQLSVLVVGGVVTVAGRAADWGNLFDYSNATGSWVAIDVSSAGGHGATTIGAQVAAVDPSGAVNFFAGGVASPAPPGVGMYDIPYGDLARVISDGWGVLGITGGLGTTAAPWVQVRSGQAVTQSPDYVIGKTIQNARKRTTWLSFWTISGALSNETASPATFGAHAFAAGAAIATQIDQYGANALHLKPDWVILDPEGFPDLHSQLDGLDIASIKGTGSLVTVTTASATTLATGNSVGLAYTYVSSLNVNSVAITVTSPRTFTFPGTFKGTLVSTGRVLDAPLQHAIWLAVLDGWRNGLASVDPTLNAGLYVDMYEYASQQLANQPMPVFMAIAWPNPVPIAHSSNVLGYIEFGNQCVAGTVQSQISMFAQPAWNGLYNTLQFNPPGYCTPSTP